VNSSRRLGNFTRRPVSSVRTMQRALATVSLNSSTDANQPVVHDLRRESVLYEQPVFGLAFQRDDFTPRRSVTGVLDRSSASSRFSTACARAFSRRVPDHLCSSSSLEDGVSEQRAGGSGFRSLP
jgi:hypothetical protein